jgi:DGQHR domain-containing protein
MTVKSSEGILARRALRIIQGAGAPVYLFSLTAGEILEVAEISRIGRGDHSELIGYQRPEVRRHVKEITDYLNGEDVLFPNPIIMALPSTVKWISSRGPNVSDGICASGTIEIPLAGLAGAKPGWIVDGQQRALALSRARRQGFPVPVNAFIADSVDVQRDQFLRINNTRPLPKGLVTELLPQVGTPLPPRLSLKQLPSALCDLLNTKDESPFQGLIKRASSSAEDRKTAVVTDTILVDALKESLQQSAGCLFPYRNLSSGEMDSTKIWLTLVTYWTAVRDTFPEAWGKPPTESRLMHAAGIRAMGRLMDLVMSMVDPSNPKADKLVRDDLSLLIPYCRWTEGRWEELRLNWDEVQSVHKHVSELSNYLIRTYRTLRAGR